MNAVNLKTDLAELKIIEKEIINNSDFNNHLNLYYEEKQKLTKFKNTYSILENDFIRIVNSVKKRAQEKHKKQYHQKGILKYLSFNHEYNWHGKYNEEFKDSEKKEIEKFIKICHEHGLKLYDRHSYIKEYDYLNPYHDFSSNKEAVGRLTPRHEWAYKTHKKVKWIRSHTSRMQKKSREKALLASYEKKSRDIADQLKTKIKEQMATNSFCPYCGGELGKRPHCPLFQSYWHRGGR